MEYQNEMLDKINETQEKMEKHTAIRKGLFTELPLKILGKVSWQS